MAASTAMTATPQDAGHQRRTRPTMSDVAAAAGVSAKTVSRVVNRESGVSPRVRRSVERAVARLGYRPDLGARNLRRLAGTTATIALLLEDVGNPFSASLLRAVEDAVAPRGISVFAASLDEDPERERTLVEMFMTRRADGLVMAPASDDHSYLAAELQAGTPVVFVDRPPAKLSADAVLTTNRSGAAEGVRHLVACGHRRIAFLGDMRSIATARERYHGYCDALRDEGIEPDESLAVFDMHDMMSADATVTSLLTGDHPPTALFTSQNLITIGALRALRRLRAHGRVAVVGFDDFPLADLVEPAVTVIAQDAAAIGSAAARILLRRLDGDTAEPVTLRIPSTLIRRGSGEIGPP